MGPVALDRAWHRAGGDVVTIGGVLALLFALAHCGVEYPNCHGDNDCRGHHEVCVNARCQQCRTATDCPAHNTCLRNRCVAGDHACENDGDCAADQHCVEHACVPRTECDEHRACPSSNPCVEGHCTPAASSTEGDEPRDNHGRLCDFTPIQFASDNAQLDEPARTALQRAAECLQREGTTHYTLIGRADARGTTEYNLALGERRARITQHYLMSLGIAEPRIPVSSEGSEGATGTDEAGYQHDRRVDFRPQN